MSSSGDWIRAALEPTRLDEDADFVDDYAVFEPVRAKMRAARALLPDIVEKVIANPSADEVEAAWEATTDLASVADLAGVAFEPGVHDGDDYEETCVAADEAWAMKDALAVTTAQFPDTDAYREAHYLASEDARRAKHFFERTQKEHSLWVKSVADRRAEVTKSWTSTGLSEQEAATAAALDLMNDAGFASLEAEVTVWTDRLAEHEAAYVKAKAQLSQMEEMAQRAKS